MCITSFQKNISGTFHCFQQVLPRPFEKARILRDGAHRILPENHTGIIIMNESNKSIMAIIYDHYNGHYNDYN
jgi:hypothetical protein